MSSHFNNYFVSIKEIRNSIKNVPYINNIITVSQKLKFRAISMLELKEIVKSLNDKTSYSKIPKKMIIDNWNIIGIILLRIINKSLKNDMFPDNWKETVVKSSQHH